MTNTCFMDSDTSESFSLGIADEIADDELTVVVDDTSQPTNGPEYASAVDSVMAEFGLPQKFTPVLQSTLYDPRLERRNYEGRSQ